MVLKVLLADGHPLTLAGIRAALMKSDGIEVVGEALSGADVMPLVRTTRPDLALIDTSISGVDGLVCLDLIRRHHPDVKVIMLAASRDERLIAAALERGASAFIVKSVHPLDLPSAIRQTVERTVFHAIPLASRREEGRRGGLTPRELEILDAVSHGLSNKAISAALCVTEQTVKFHLTNIYRKLGVHNRTSALRYAHEHRLVDSDALSVTA
jgi:DNA-binding NarL/FixJ family response regulator